MEKKERERERELFFFHEACIVYVDCTSRSTSKDNRIAAERERERDGCEKSTSVDCVS